MTHAGITLADEDALRRALDEARRDPMQAKRFARKVEKDLLDAQISAAYFCQTKNLKLKLWECQPMYGDVKGRDGSVEAKAYKLLQRLLAGGLSRFEPNPEAALAKIEQAPAA